MTFLVRALLIAGICIPCFASMSALSWGAMFPAKQEKSGKKGPPDKDMDVRVDVKLDRKMIEAGKALSGRIALRISKKAPDVADPKGEVRLNGPQIAFVLDGNPLPSYLHVELAEAFGPEFAVGKTHEVAFRIQASPRLAQILGGEQKQAPLFTVGAHHLSVLVNSAPSNLPLNPDPDFFGRFHSPREEFRVEAGKASVLNEDDLLARMSLETSPFIRGELAEFYAQLALPLKKLSVFTPAPLNTSLDHSEIVPFLHVLSPGIEWKVFCTPPEDPVNPLCTVQLGGENRVAPTPQELVIPVSAPEGVYRIVCPFHNKTWGWILVRGD